MVRRGANGGGVGVRGRKEYGSGRRRQHGARRRGQGDMKQDAAKVERE